MSPDDADSQSDPEPGPPSLGPEVPSVDVPEVGKPGGNAGDAADADVDGFTGDADSETVRLFWRLVVVLDVGIAALALGPMFVYFEGDWQRGLLLTGFGVAVLAYGASRYRRYRADDATDEPAETVEADVDARSTDTDVEGVPDPDPAADDPKP